MKTIIGMMTALTLLGSFAHAGDNTTCTKGEYSYTEYYDLGDGNGRTVICFYQGDPIKCRLLTWHGSWEVVVRFYTKKRPTNVTLRCF